MNERDYQKNITLAIAKNISCATSENITFYNHSWIKIDIPPNPTHILYIIIIITGETRWPVWFIRNSSYTASSESIPWNGKGSLVAGHSWNLAQLFGAMYPGCLKSRRLSCWRHWRSKWRQNWNIWRHRHSHMNKT